MPRLYKLFCVALLLLVAPYSFAQQNAADDPIKDSLGMAIGVLLGANLEQMGFNPNDFKSSEFVKGFESAAKGKPTMPDTAAQRIFQNAAIAIQMKAQDPTASASVSDPQLSEAFGTMAGPGVVQNGLSVDDVNMLSVQKGFESVLSGKPVFDLPNAQRLFTTHPKVKAKQEEMRVAQAQIQAEAEKAGLDFLAANKKKKGVITTKSGLQYQIIKKGKKKAKKPTLTSTVKVHYHGTLIDGTVFDSSVERGETIEFPLEHVILGWQEGVALMPVGSKFKFFIPHNLAYGGQPSGKIPAYSVLIFEVELFEITN